MKKGFLNVRDGCRAVILKRLNNSRAKIDEQILPPCIKGYLTTVAVEEEKKEQEQDIVVPRILLEQFDRFFYYGILE
jgi:D-Tyr-tRNAtyr deacylase